MTLILRLIAKYALWIYILCGLGMAFYLRAALAARREGSQAIFALERETAAGRVYRSSGMILLLLLIAVGVYTLSNYVELPSFAASPIASPTSVIDGPTPTARPRSPTSTVADGTTEPTPTSRPRRTPIVLPTVTEATPAATVAPANCQHANVQLQQPGRDQVINQGIQVRGTADKDDFDRYEFKFQSRDFSDEWHWIETFRTPVHDGDLGFWSTAHLPPGNYRFMLISIDKSGNSQECVVPIVIQH